MKKILFIVAIGFSLVACKSKDNKENASTEPIVMEMSIEGMTCNGCVATVEASVKQMGEGINAVKANLDSANAVVEFIPAQVSADEIKKAIELNGYKVTKMENQ